MVGYTDIAKDNPVFLYQPAGLDWVIAGSCAMEVGCAEGEVMG